MAELKINMSIVSANDKLAYALRAKRLLIEKNNSKLGDADYLFWHYNKFLPLIKIISGTRDFFVSIAEFRKGATVAIPPIIEGANLVSTKEAGDKYALERTTLEADKKYDTAIKNENPEFR